MSSTFGNFIKSVIPGLAPAYDAFFVCNILCDTALSYGGRLISVIRSRNISAHILVQTQSQLRAVYKDHAETIIGCCSSILFLGGKEPSTLKSILEALGKETIDTYSESDTRGQQRSHGLNYQKLGKQLLAPDELAIMSGSRCILQLQGVNPFYSRKYDITKHPMYPLLADANEENRFEVGR